MKKHYIKRLFATVAVLLCCITANAHDFEVDGIYYKILSLEDLTVEVTYKGDNYSSYDEYTGDVIIPSTVTYKSKSLTVTSIGASSFSSCDGLTSITIPNSVTTIGYYAFYGCSSLTSITIGNRVTSIGDYAFEYCFGLKEVHISDLAAWCNISFEGSTTNPLFYAHNLYLNGELVTDLVIPNSVTSIGKSAFYDCDGLTSITIPNSVTSIGNSAFAYCSKIKKVELDCTTIGSWFSGKSSIEEIVLGDNVTRIGNSAFNGCSGITNISLKCTTPPTVDSNNFTNAHYINVTVYVPQGAIEAYQAADVWKEFWDIQEQGATDEPDTETKKCATPVIGYENGALTITSATEGVKFITEIKNSDVAMYYDGRIELTATYNISTYATLAGYENSDTVNATLCWVENGDSDEDDTTNIITVPAVAVLVTSANGAVAVSCSLEGETVAVYTTDGTLVGSAAITNGSATIQSGLSKGSVAIVKIGNKSVKVVVD